MRQLSPQPRNVLSLTRVSETVTPLLQCRGAQRLGRNCFDQSVSSTDLPRGVPLCLQRAKGFWDGQMASLKLRGDMVLPKASAARDRPQDDPIREHPRDTGGLGFPAFHSRQIAWRLQACHARSAECWTFDYREQVRLRARLAP